MIELKSSGGNSLPIVLASDCKWDRNWPTNSIHALAWLFDKEAALDTMSDLVFTVLHRLHLSVSWVSEGVSWWSTNRSFSTAVLISFT